MPETMHDDTPPLQDFPYVLWGWMHFGAAVTSGLNSWVSLDCSITPTDALPTSIQVRGWGGRGAEGTQRTGPLVGREVCMGGGRGAQQMQNIGLGHEQEVAAFGVMMRHLI